MKQLEQTSLWPDIKKIIHSGVKPIKYEYVGKLHTVKKDIDILKVVTIDVVRDYVNNIGDLVYVEFVMPLGDYVKFFYPYRDNLEFTLTRRLLLEVGDSSKPNQDKEEIRYKAVFLVEENPNIRVSEYEHIDKRSLDLVDMLSIKLQLLNRSLEPIRIKTTGGIFRNVKIADVLKALIPGESMKITVDGKKAVQAFDIVKPDNNETIEHVVIPHSTPIANVPTVVQENGIGVYNAGIGSYLQAYKDKMTWFIYPLFNPNRFKENIPKMIIYSVPRNRFPAIERTYRTQANIIYVLATLGKAYKSHGETAYMDKGSGYRITDARTIMKKPIKMTEKGPVGIRNEINHEINFTERSDNLNYVPVGKDSISSNPFAEVSRVLERTNGRIDFTWVNAKHSLIYPGMPCKFVYLNKYNEIEETTGVILFVHTLISLAERGLSTHTYHTSCQITAYVNKLIETPDKN